MNHNELAELRDRRLRQAEKRGLIRATCALRRAGVRVEQATWVNEKNTIAAELRGRSAGDHVLRVWANLEENGAVVAFSTGPSRTPEENIVFEVAFQFGVNDPVLEGYAPGDWEVAFLTWVSTEILDVRLSERRDAIKEEAEITTELIREAVRWGAGGLPS